jgi:hypothetical protein
MRSCHLFQIEEQRPFKFALARHIAFSHDHAEEHSVRRAPAFRITLGPHELSIIVTALFVAILMVALAIAAS